MGIILDIVPNHMAVSSENPWWEDLLRNGRNSQCADWFDVAWTPNRATGRDRIVLPILGDSLANVIQRGELVLTGNSKEQRISYYHHNFPLAVAGGATDDLESALAHQHYELVYWKEGSRELNYRRFFDVNDLAAIRVEKPEVFNATHALIIDLVRRGMVDGVRVDHIDGLLDPRAYLARLSDELRVAAGNSVPVYVEKILADGEKLPDDWSTAGTTGYDFLAAVDDLLISTRGFDFISSAYRSTNRGDTFANIATNAKRKTLKTSLNPDVRRLAPMLKALAANLGAERLSVAQYASTITEFVAKLPVYRTYFSEASPAGSERDRALTSTAIRAAIEDGNADATSLTHLKRVLLDDWTHHAEEVQRERLAFVTRLQQLSGPAAAKGVEDTALYSFAPLASRSEVGANPGASLEDSAGALHGLLQYRATFMPISLNAVSTHDTKRSADARARIDALSEHSAQWIRLLRAWSRRHRSLQQLVTGRLAPSVRLQNFIYQSLVAIWPEESLRDGSDAILDELRERVATYMLKAARESKLTTSWTEPDMKFEATVAAFLKSILDQNTNSEFIREMDQLVALITPATRANVIVREVLHHTSPGVPDTYQGDELWFAALVDPDNRRPLDWTGRERAMHRVSEPGTFAAEYFESGEQTSIVKLAVIRALLRLRAAQPQVFSGAYERLPVSGRSAANVFAFGRRDNANNLLIVAVRHGASALSLDDASLHAQTGGDEKWICALQGVTVSARDGLLALGDILSKFPATVLVNSS